MIEHFICQVPLFYRALIPGGRWCIPAYRGKSVYLTFDDGPIPEVTPWVLDKLDELDVKATFFCVGDNVRKYPELFEEIKRRGHQVGNHTFHHIKGLEKSARSYIEDVEAANDLIHSRYFRPPHGHLLFSQVRELSKRYELIMWDVITRDYNRKLSPERVLYHVKRYTRNGSIIVFHDSLKAEKNMREAMPQAVRWLKEQGYTFMRIGDMP
ncbi:polysaccharide deacetylase [Porphyromonas macacae]|uniref:Polysaccharide deacetylase n=1 Tax=Porphyromonas macacae TaxID=28115 RepID=A0A0A2E9T8_9PORP|nr:polysaccharide deacetylase family protein [Porphyromonas macacae]KGN75673.1 polysaccharide deacetylase [Porphyromonas macacae]